MDISIKKLLKYLVVCNEWMLCPSFNIHLNMKEVKDHFFLLLGCLSNAWLEEEEPLNLLKTPLPTNDSINMKSPDAFKVQLVAI